MSDARWAEEVVEDIMTALGRHAFRANSEADLHQQVCRVLKDIGVSVQTEVSARSGRYDLLVGGHVVLELKVRGNAEDVDRQAQRYAKDDAVHAIVVATTSARLARALQEPGDRTLGGKPFHVIALRGF